MRTAKEMVDFCIENKFDNMEGAKAIKHFEVVERNLTANDNIVFAFVSNSVKDRKGNCLLGGALAVAFTDKSLIYAQRRSIMGDYVKTVSYDNINDVSSEKGWIFGDVVIDSVAEYMRFSGEKETVEKIRSSVLEVIENYRSKKNSANLQVNQISAADEIKKFKELLDMGIITQEEFDAKKKQLLGL